MHSLKLFFIGFVLMVANAANAQMVLEYDIDENNTQISLSLKLVGDPRGIIRSLWIF